MSYGTIKVDTVTFTNSGVDQSITVSGLVESLSGNLTVTGTLQGQVVIGTNSVSGATITGNTGQFTSVTATTGIFTSQISGATITGNTGRFTTFTGGTATFTSGVFASGTAAAPSVSVGTVTNGVYSPGTNQLALSTNGTGRLFVDASGNVGVGAAPGRTFQVTNSSNAIISAKNGTIEGVLNATTNGVNVGSASNDFLTISTNGFERIRVTSAGNVGIGTSSPDALLTVNGVGAHGLGSAAAPSFAFTGDLNTGIYSPGADQVAISTAGTGRLFVDASGNVGVGAVPVVAFNGQTHLTVNHSAGGTTVAGINLAIDGTRRASLITYPSNSEALRITAESATLPITVHTNSSERLRIDSSGRVGIGTTGPSTVLHCSALDAVVTLQGTRGTGASATIGTGGTNSQNLVITAGTDLYQRGATHLFQNVAGTTEYARIDSSGRLLVGTSTPDTTYRVSATGYTPKVEFKGTDVYQLALNRTNDSCYLAIASKQTASSGVTVGGITFNQWDGSNLLNAAGISAAVDGTPGANDMPGRLVFSTTANGASSPTERMRITENGITYFNVTSAPGSSNFGTSLDFGRILSFRNVNGTLDAAAFGGTAGEAKIMGDGDLENTNNRYTGISDIKLKQNVEDSASQWDDIKAVRVRKYELKANPDRKHIGVIAQELEQVCPGLVIDREDRTGDTYKSVAYSVLYMKAVKALQEAMERIETLEAKVAALESA